MLEAALKYAAIGWHVFPCHAGTKNPATDNGFYAATTDAETIRKWWAKYPNANIGHYPYPSGNAVIDVDVKKGDGRVQLEALEAKHGKLPSTQKQITPSTGDHIFFRATQPMPNNKLSPDIDIRCANGYVMLAPSFADGHAYEWLDGWSPEDAVLDLDFAEMPQWVIDVQQAGIREAAKPSNTEGSPTYIEPDETAQASIAERLPAFLSSAPKAAKRFDGDTDGLRDTSGSAMDFSMCALLKIGGFDYSETRFILEQWPHGSSDPQRFTTERYWERLWLRSSSPEENTAAMFEEVITKTKDFLQRSSEVASLEEYKALTQEISSDKYLTNETIDMTVKSLHTAFGKSAGLSINTIRKAITPKRTSVITYGLFKHWVFIEAQNKYFDLNRRLSVSAQAFRVRWDGHPEVVENGNSNAVAYASFNNIRTVYDAMFWPGADIIFEHEGALYINTYHAPDWDLPEVLNAEQQKAADSFYAHLGHIFPDAADQMIALDWMAYLVQRPQTRIHYALVMKGTEGDGKTYFSNVMDAVTRSVNQVAGSAIGGQFNGFAQGARIVAVEEIRVASDKRYESLDRIKPLITNSQISIEEKGRDIRTVPNFSSYMLFTNHADAMPLGKSDRRYAVLETRFQSEEQLFAHFGGSEATADYFDELFDLLECYPVAYAHVLHNHRISDSFRPKGRAPNTKAKARMLEASKPEPQRLLEDAIEKHSCSRICKDLLDVTYLNQLCTDGFGNMTTPLPKTRAMSGALRDLGYLPIEGGRMKIAGVTRYIWYNHMHHDDASAREAARLAAEEQYFDDI